MTAGRGVFRAAIDDGVGGVDSGYLAMAALMVAVITAIPAMVAFTAVSMFMAEDHKFDVQGLGIGIGSVCGGFGVALGAIGVFRMGDREHAPAIVAPPAPAVQIVNAPVAAPPAPAKIDGDAVIAVAGNAKVEER